MKWSFFLLLAALAFFPSAQAETLFEVNFAEQPAGELGNTHKLTDHNGSALFWQGPAAKEFGYFSITDGPEAGGGSGKLALAFHDNSPERGKAPGFSVQLADAPAADAKTLTVEAKLLVPVAGPYLGLIGVGKGSWAGAAALLTLSNGKIQTWQPGDVYTTVGAYDPNVWFELRIVLDLAQKTFDVYLNGEKAANAIPWAHTPKDPVNYFECVADLSPTERAGDPALFMETLKISAE